MLMVPKETLENKAFTHSILIDGDLGGCGQGEFGDPNTYLPQTWAALIDFTKAESVLDVGCGLGYSTAFFQGYGLEATGLEGSHRAVDQAVCDQVQIHDFREGKPILGPFDLGWSSEFLEHLEQDCEENAFAAFVKCKYVVINAAFPGQGGHHHVNEQFPDYWIERFEAHGFTLDENVTMDLRAIAEKERPGCYFGRTGLFFRKSFLVAADPVWTDVPGDLTYAEGKHLQQFAKDKRVLVLGDSPRAAICLAGVAKQVTAHCDEACVRKHGHDSRIEPLDGVDLPARRFDMILVDTDDVEKASKLAISTLLPGGTVHWADFGRPTVREGIAEAGIPLEGVNAFGRMGFMLTQKPQVMVCMPHSGDTHIAAMKSAFVGCQGKYADRVAFVDRCFGCLTNNFNVFLSMALDLRDAGKITHLAMIHSDISAEQGWVDVLAEEMCKKRAIVISAVVTIKDPDDDRTSTAIGVERDPWHIERFIRLRHREGMPETFTSADVCQPGETLLINTGLMLIDLRDEFWDTHVFRVIDRIWKDEEGKRHPEFRPEDWEMSRDLAKAGKPYASTWRPLTTHHGEYRWDNRIGARFLAKPD